VNRNREEFPERKDEGCLGEEGELKRRRIKRQEALMAEDKKFLHSAGLVVLGAIIGIGPSVYIAHMQAQNQQRQLILDRRISLLRDLSKTLHEFMSQIINDMTSIESKAIEARDRVAQRHKVTDADRSVLVEINREASVLQNHIINSQGELATTFIMVHAIFGIKETQIPTFTVFEYSDIPQEILSPTPDQYIKAINQILQLCDEIKNKLAALQIKGAEALKRLGDIIQREY